MRKRYKLKKITNKRCYSFNEIATTLSVHIQTVRQWHKEGLLPIDPDATPFLFLGSDLYKFLAIRLSKKRVKLSSDEIYCLSCGKAVKPTKTTIFDRHVTIGTNKKSIIIKGECPECRSKLSRFSIGVDEQSTLNIIDNNLIVGKSGQLSWIKDDGV
jgi:hypothetical protein